MAGANDHDIQALISEIERSWDRFDFFEVMRRIDAHASSRFGTSSRATDEPLRLGQPAYLEFASSTLSGLRRANRVTLLVRFLGLLGPNGPLPLHITEYVRDRLRNHRDPTLSQFFDVFNHRFLSLFYRAWAAGQPAVARDRAEDEFAQMIASFLGMALEGAIDSDDVPKDAKLFHAGMIGERSPHAEGIEAILEDDLGLPVRVEQFIGRWMRIQPEERLLLGRTPRTGTLGRSAILGASTFECRQTFRIVLGPMTLAQYELLLPDAEVLRRVRSWVDLWVRRELRAEVQLVLRAEQTPRTELGGYGRLGYTTWLHRAPPSSDPDTLVFRPSA